MGENEGLPRPRHYDDSLMEAAPGSVDIDALVAELKARVAERRRSGDYPEGLEEELAAHFRRIVGQHPASSTALPDFRPALEALASSLAFDARRIPADSRLRAGRAAHRAVARAVGRQVQGVFEQVREFGQATQAALGEAAEAIGSLGREVREEVGGQVGALFELVAAQERAAVRLERATAELKTYLATVSARVTGLGVGERRREFRPGYDVERFTERFRGTRQQLLDRYEGVAERLVGYSPVLDLGCGRGELLELLGKRGVEAFGVELDEELAQGARERGFDVEHGDGIARLGALDDNGLGGLVLVQVVEQLSSQELVELVSLAAQKVRPGGQVLVEAVNPQSRYAHASYFDPTHERPVHPAYLTFLFEETGFASVGLEWRSSSPTGDALEEDAGLAPESSFNANVRRLNELLFSPQEYLVLARR